MTTNDNRNDRMAELEMVIVHMYGLGYLKTIILFL